MRKINEIIIHCSATRDCVDIGVEEITRWHVARNMFTIGYHFVVRLDGTVELGRDLEIGGAHCLGHNKDSIGICYVGGLDSEWQAKDTRTIPQKESLKILISELRKKFGDIPVHGHRDYNKNKECPCFDAWKEYNP